MATLIDFVFSQSIVQGAFVLAMLYVIADVFYELLDAFSPSNSLNGED